MVSIMETNKGDLLTVKNLVKYYATVQVLKDVTFQLGRGKVLGICGENGAGKSTLINILGGIIPRNGGEIIFDQKPYAPQNAKGAAASGIAIIHQELNLFSNLTIKENIYMGRMQRRKIPFVLDKRRMSLEAKRNLSLLDDTIDPEWNVEDLSIGQKQMTEIAKAISMDAKLIVFDEPTTSLSETEKAKLFSVIEKLVAKGISIIYISHELDDVFHLCDEIMVLRDGQSVIQRPKSDITKAEVIRNMVGRELTCLADYVEREKGEDIFSIKGLRKAGKFEDVSLAVREGEIVGMFGLMGAGRSEALRAAFGIDAFDAGEVFINGRALSKPTPKDCIESGAAFVTENRREEGLLMRKNITSNLALASIKRFQRKFLLADKKREQVESRKIVERLHVKTYNMNRQIAANLSGGNQQKVVIGKWLMTNPKVMILDEPTKGVDVGAKFEIYNYINDLAVQKSAILMISSEMEELMGICDRILVMCKGRITGEFKREAFSRENLLACALGGEDNA